MSAPTKSRWAAEDPEDDAIIAQRKREKEEKRRAKAEKQRQLEEQARLQTAQAKQQQQADALNGDSEAPPKKRRRLSNEQPQTSAVSESAAKAPAEQTRSTLLRFPGPEWAPCRLVDNFERLNHIEEGSYGWVSRAKDITTGEVVALKKLKMENSPDGFPVTGLREIQTLLEARHTNIVYLREVVMGTKMDEYALPSYPLPPGFQCPLPALVLLPPRKVQDTPVLTNSGLWAPLSRQQCIPRHGFP